MDQHTGAKFACNVCFAVYNSKSSLSDHKRSKHLKIRSKTCDICGLHCHSNTHYKNHLLIHSGDKRKTVINMEFFYLRRLT